MPLNDVSRNAMLNHLAGLIAFVSLHTDNPGTTGVNEVTGGSPAYARKAITWNAAATSNLDNLANPTWDVPAGMTITHIGFWSAVSGGTFYGSADIVDEIFAGQGTYTASDVDVNLT